MGEVIELIKQDGGSGYMMDDANKTINGVYVNDIGAVVEYERVYLGTKVDDGIYDALLTNIEDMNRFCIMWLAINNPEVLNED